MLAFCGSEIHGIKFVLITSNDIEMSHHYLKEKCSTAKKIPGTRGFNQFIPVSQVTIKIKNEYCMLTKKIHSVQKCSDEEDLILLLVDKRKLFRDFRAESQQTLFLWIVRNENK